MLAASAVVAVLVSGVLLLVFSRNGVKEEAPVDARRMIPSVHPSLKVKQATATTDVTVAELERPKIPVGNVITAQSNVGRIETHADGSVVTSKVEVVFKRPFERALQVALRPGGFGASSIMSMQRRYSEDQILQMLKEITRPDPEDDERVAGLKNRVQKLKEDMLLEIQKGRTVGEVIDDLRRQCATERGMINLADKTVREAVHDGDTKTVRETLEKTNRILEKNGLPPRIVTPQLNRQIREMEAAERAARAEKASSDAEELTRAMNESIQ